MKSFTKVIITGDVQRPFIGQAQNIEWLYYLQKDLYSCPVTQFNIVSSYLSLDDWVNTYVDVSAPSPLFMEYPIDSLHSTLIAGFEMPYNLIYQLEQADIPYVNYICYPIRYAHDIIMGYKSNCLSYSECPNLYFQQCANLLKAQYKRQPTLTLEPNTCLIIGQHPMDTSLINNGTLQTFDFNAIDATQFSRILFKPQLNNTEPSPYQGVEIVTDNIYDLLSDENVTTLTGINSSVLTEAQYFSKTVIRQGRKWQDGYTPITASEFLRIDAPPNTLRESCNSWWGKKK